MFKVSLTQANKKMKKTEFKADTLLPKVPAQASRDARVELASLDLRRIITAAKRHFHSQEKSEISGAQLWALLHVKNAPGLTVMELAKQLSIHQSTTSNLIEKLESSGHLRRERHPSDRRLVQLFVTTTGTKALKRIPEPGQGMIPKAINRLSDNELALVEKALGLLSREFVDPKTTSTKG